LGKGKMKGRSNSPQTDHLVVPYSVGGGTDVAGADWWLVSEKKLGQPVVVENKNWRRRGH